MPLERILALCHRTPHHYQPKELAVVGQLMQRTQREGDVVHVVAQEITDLSAELVSVGSQEVGFPLHHGHGAEFRDDNDGWVHADEQVGT